jgi:ElaA protein
MSINTWEVKTFQEFTVDELFDVLKLRVAVFVVEQKCAYRELDEYDRHAETRPRLSLKAKSPQGTNHKR